MKHRFSAIVMILSGLLFLFTLSAGQVWADDVLVAQGQGQGQGQGKGQGQKGACENPGACRGCCSGHGGVVCVKGVTQCGDGTALSENCRKKECNVCN